MPASPQHVVVLGSGVVGLTSALLLARHGYQVDVVARDFASDSTSQAFASPWAGALWCPTSSPSRDPRQCRWEAEGYKQLAKLIPDVAMRIKIRRFEPTEAGLLEHWYKDVVPNYRRLSAAECPANEVGVEFDSLSINAPLYVAWLAQECGRLGVKFHRKTLRSISQAFDVALGVKIVVNATGLGAKSLVGVQDQAVEPVRGQTIIASAPHLGDNCIMDTANPLGSTYIIPRPGGEVILGGCYNTGNWDTSVDFNLVDGILERAYALNPALGHHKGPQAIQIIGHNVGLRPSRRGGPRLEAEKVKRGTVVHAYGIGSAGFQASYGMASDVLSLVEAAGGKEAKRQARL